MGGSTPPLGPVRLPTVLDASLAKLRDAIRQVNNNDNDLVLIGGGGKPGLDVMISLDELMFQLGDVAKVADVTPTPREAQPTGNATAAKHASGMRLQKSKPFLDHMPTAEPSPPPLLPPTKEGTKLRRSDWRWRAVER